MTEFKFLGKQPPSDAREFTQEDWGYAQSKHFEGALCEAANALGDIRFELINGKNEEVFEFLEDLENKMRVSLGEVDEK